MKKKVWRRMLSVLLILVLLGAAVGGALVACVYARSRAARPLESADCLIVLGARVWESGEPSDALQYRLDSAVEAYNAGLAGAVIVCGAQGSNEPAREASVMKRVLVEMGVPAECIYEEDASYNTEQNIENAKAIMDERGFASAIIVTSDYHVQRALWLAEDAGIETVYGYPAASPRPFFTIWRLRTRAAASWVVYWLRYIL